MPGRNHRHIGQCLPLEKLHLSGPQLSLPVQDHRRQPVPYSTFDVDVLTVTELSGFVVESHLCDPAYDDPVFVAQLVTLIAESVPWLDVQPFYLGVVSVFQNEETSPGSVTTVFAGHH